MAVSLIQQRKIPAWAGINWRHPLARGLVRSYEFNEYRGLKSNNKASGGQWPATITKSSAWDSGGLLLNESSEYATCDFYKIAANSSGSFVIGLQPQWDISDESDYHYFFDTVGGVGTRNLLYYNNTGPGNPIEYYTAGASRFVHVVPWEAYKDYLLIITWPTSKLYVNGVLVKTGTTGAVSACETLTIGIRQNYLRSARSRFYFFRIYDRELTAPEAMALYLDPYCMFQREMPWQAWYAVAVAAGWSHKLLGLVPPYESVLEVPYADIAKILQVA